MKDIVLLISDMKLISSIKLIRAFALMLGLSLFAGCASTPEESPTAKEIYEEAHELQSQASYDEAAAKFDELIATFPASPYSQQGMLDSIYLNYQRSNYAGTLDAANRFLQTHPDHKNASYALYLQGLAHFREDQNLVDRLGFQDPTERNPESMRQAFFSFKRLVEEYPDSKYAEDSAYRMRYLINALARHEIHIATYYLRRNAPAAAVGRAKQVLDLYKDSTSLEAALTVLMRAYQMMGATEDLEKTRRVLELNFPENPLLSEILG